MHVTQANCIIGLLSAEVVHRKLDLLDF